MNTINMQIDSDGVAILTIDVQDRPMNVMTPEFLADLAAAVERVVTDAAIKGAVITSGKDAFMAGADLHELVESFAERDPQALLATCGGLHATFRRMEAGGKPFAAAINGTALGGGLEVCLACHRRVAADRKGLVLGQPEVQVGLIPGGGGTQRLPRLIGIEPALRLLTEGRHVKPAEARELGFIDDVVTGGEEVETARKWVLANPDATQPWDRKGFKVPGGAGLTNPGIVQTLSVGSALVQKQTNHNYPAPITVLSAVYEGTVLPIEAALEIEAKYFVSLLMDPVSRNMMRTLFVNKNAADKLVHRPQGPEKLEVRKLGILGAGMMGAGIAYVSARAGMEVVLLDVSAEKAEAGKNYSRKLLAKAVERGKTTSDDAGIVLDRIRATNAYGDLAGCDLVIEAVFEDRKIKADVTAKAEAELTERAVFASNTSTLPITGLAGASVRPEQFIGIHFFSPVDKMPLVEVIVGERTGEIAIAQALDYVQQIGKTPIVVNDSRGFYTSRVFSVFSREGIRMLAEGVNPALIENVAKQAGMPVGPLAVTDEVSLELSWHITQQTMADLGDAYAASPADEVVRLFVEALGRKGRKAGAGFYDYPEGQEKRLWPGLAEHFPRAAEQPEAAEIEKRLLYAQALETVRCLDEGVVTHAADADIGSVFGWGFPAYTGGTLSFIETVGVQEFVAEADRLAAAYGERFAAAESLRRMAAEGRTFYGSRAAAA